MQNKNDNSIKFNILSLLIQNLKNLQKNSKNSEELYIFLIPHENLRINNLSYENNSEEMLSIVLGGAYDFKKLKLSENGISVQLADEKGKFHESHIPYEAILGFFNSKMYFKNNQVLVNITLSELKNKEVNLNYIFNNSVANIFQNLTNNGVEKNQIIKLTFLENFPNIQIPNSIKTGDKLLVLILEDDCWSSKLLAGGIQLSFKNVNNNANKIPIYIPYNAIVTCVDTNSRSFLNRNVKIVEEDFEDINSTVYAKENLIFVDFDQILEDEESEDMSDMSIFGLNFTSSKKEKLKDLDEIEELNNLIIGEFDKDKKE
jgi:hypothetical protein